MDYVVLHIYEKNMQTQLISSFTFPWLLASRLCEKWASYCLQQRCLINATKLLISWQVWVNSQAVTFLFPLKLCVCEALVVLSFFTLLVFASKTRWFFVNYCLALWCFHWVSQRWTHTRKCRLSNQPLLCNINVQNQNRFAPPPNPQRFARLKLQLIKLNCLALPWATLTPPIAPQASVP